MKEFLVIRDRIKNLYRELNTANPEEVDRAETRICGFDIRVWRTKINCRIETHLGYKSSWEKTFHVARSVSELTEMLYKHKGRDESFSK